MVAGVAPAARVASTPYASQAACGSSPSSPRPPRCSSRWASATRLLPSRTSATTPGGARAAAGDARRHRPRPRARRDRPRGARATEQGRAIYELDEDALASLAAGSDRHPGAVRRLRRLLRRRAGDRRAAGPAAAGPLARPHDAGRGARGRAHARRRPRTARTRASSWWRTRASRIDRVRLAVRAAEPVRVAALEWLDPVFVAGHWTPQLIEYAGGFDVLGMPGEHSEQRSWEEVAAAAPEVVVVMPCGYDAERALDEATIRATSWPRSAPGGSSRSTPRPTSPAPARGWSTGSSCWRTSCTRTGCPRRRRACARCSSRSRASRSRVRRRSRRPTTRDRADGHAAERPAAARRAGAPATWSMPSAADAAADQAAEVPADRDVWDQERDARG